MKHPWPTAPQRAAREVDPIVLQIVEGTLNSIEAEIEYAIERTARSPMIREAHDYRVGLFDRYCRKLTGRSYSAMPNAVVRDFPPETMRPGDVFLMNDTYLTEGSIGHLPDLCSTVPVFHDGEVVAYIQAFGHHDDIGGRVPGSMPGTAVTVFEEGLAIPPVKLYSEGVRNDAVFTIIKRNTRVPDMLAADLDSEVQACVMGARRMASLFERFGARDGRGLLPGHPRQVPRHLPQRAAAEDRRRRIRLGGLRRARRRHRSEAAQDRAQDDQARRAHHARLHRHRSAVDRADQLAGRLRRRRVPDQVDRADPAQSRRHAGARRRNPRQRRRLRGLRHRVSAQGHADHAGMAGRHQCALVRAAALPRAAGRRGGAGGDGRMPADQETIRYTGFFGIDADGKPFLSREVLGGGSGGRYYADGNDAIHIVPDSRNQPAEFTETRFPLLVEKLALRTDSGGAGKRRGGLGYEKHYRALVDCRTIVTADRVRLGCYGLNGGKAGQPFCVTVDVGGDGARSRRPGRRRAGAGRPDRARGHHRRRRLGRSAGARAGAGAARRDRGQGVGRRRRATTMASC